ncbi:MAG: hypothetical protein NC044_05625 [Prevotella sp.]|nr:hypothetical protein [Prevotella sp.]
MTQQNKSFNIDDKIAVFDQLGTIVNTQDAPDYYGVQFKETGKTYAVRAEHIETLSITDRIKTLEDAIDALGEDNAYVKHLQIFNEQMNGCFSDQQDIKAFLELRIITAALNEGWTPDWSDEDEYKYFPWFYICTAEEWEAMSDEDKSRCVGRSYNNSGASGGLVCANAVNASSNSNSSIGSRLAFKSRDLAMYCGKQFIEIWADFIL